MSDSELNPMDWLRAAGEAVKAKAKARDDAFVVSKTTVEKYAFDGNTTLTKVKIASSVKKIGQGAFSGCKKLSEVVFEERTAPVEFEKNTFYGCSSLERIRFPEGIEALSDGMFTSTALSEVWLPSTMKSVGNAFWLCDELEINYNGTMKAWKTVSEGADLGPVKRRRIVCTDGVLGGLKTVNPAAKWFSFEGTALDSCSGSAEGVIVVPEYVTRIYSKAFAGCGKITKVIIPVSVKKLGSSLFRGCKDVEVCYAGTEAEWNAVEKAADSISGSASLHFSS